MLTSLFSLLYVTGEFHRLSTPRQSHDSSLGFILTQFEASNSVSSFHNDHII